MNMVSSDRNSLSELESMSDSDWLDIASSRASDTDSVAGFSSDRDLDARPSSRQSFNSNGSSRDSDVHAWVGLADDLPDESPRLPLSLTARSVAYNSDLAPLIPDEQETEDHEEEQRVKAALDQSMMSTLSATASRSNSNSLNASLSSIVQSRDLRLSFPDPLTSSRDALLNTSYDHVVDHIDADVLPSMTADSVPETDPAPTTADPGAHATPVVPEDDTCEAAISPDFYIVLYGSSSAVKWSLIDKLLERAAKGQGLTLTSKIVGLIDGYVRFLSASDSSHNRVVSVLDRTEVLSADDVGFSIIDLPCSADQLLDAEQHWETLGVSRRKIVALSSGSSVVDQEDVDRAGTRQITRALRPLFFANERKPAQRLAVKHAWKILAVFSVVLGCAIKGSLNHAALQSMSSQQQTAPPPTWSLASPITPAINQSVPAPATHSALIPSALKDLALAVLSPSIVTSTPGAGPSTVPSTEHAAPNSASEDAPSECACGCGLITWAGKSHRDTDLALRPTPPPPSVRQSGKSALALIPSPTHHQGKGKGKGREIAPADESLFAVGTWSGTSLSNYLSLHSVASVVMRDIQEILDALDELSYAILRQTALVWESSKDAALALQAMVQHEHKRMLTKAAELTEFGGRLLSSVQERVRGRVAIAKSNAKAVRKSVLPARVWKAATRLQTPDVGNIRKLAREKRKKAGKRARRALRQ
ncbi:hypothetical protein POSPLADRAFT_1067785 [Postia placenta MAD-698-R-SB12]|uniref:Uncharacterized protein n=1 Tax=Postia placenta MAD-698-R-SB12 TaxID=670580 RepID=A0A1X6MNI7_9APHY|nr:hypothetical protein POSPLADRAFT_1067785 [Postia placenta MAD-698-R-SB12]OSX57752.1 hypothetical protein POSPLADRAFT_1067785 [Postia placenta MAD-698-R-SB12]